MILSLPLRDGRQSEPATATIRSLQMGAATLFMRVRARTRYQAETGALFFTVVQGMTSWMGGVETTPCRAATALTSPFMRAVSKITSYRKSWTINGKLQLSLRRRIAARIIYPV